MSRITLFCVNFLPWNLRSCKFFDKSQVWVCACIFYYFLWKVVDIVHRCLLLLIVWSQLSTCCFWGWLNINYANSYQHNIVSQFLKIWLEHHKNHLNDIEIFKNISHWFQGSGVGREASVYKQWELSASTMFKWKVLLCRQVSIC